ncbi:MAG: hypothetical protein FWH05_04650 [Oscillospiraceae bacterium]|nr:hypothetical protein [Oscillospiraceae bacterium]
MIKRAISAGLAIIIVTNMFMFTANANTGSSESFEAYVIRHLEGMASEIDITAYAARDKALAADAPSAFLKIVTDNPQLFHVETKIRTSFKTESRSGNIVEYKYTNIEYNINKNQLALKKRRFDTAAQNALKVVDNSMSDFEKALALHNYLVLNIEYDTTRRKVDIHNAYGALVNGVSVCQGYAMAYKYLLGLLGIESVMLVSEAMEHAWNYVKIGRSWYHVDVTYDDPLLQGKTDQYGRVSHKHFMLSDAAIRKIGHRGWNTGGLPAANSTIYDNLFFRNAESSMVRLGDLWYYIEFDEKNSSQLTNLADINAHNFTTKRTRKIHTINSTWFVAGTNKTSWWQGNYSSLAAYNGLLYFNDSNSLYSLNPTNGETKKLLTVREQDGAIYGFTMKENVISYVVKHSPEAQNTIKRTRA